MLLSTALDFCLQVPKSGHVWNRSCWPCECFGYPPGKIERQQHNNVLGALPLIIAGIEAYNDGLDPVKSFMRWERELPQLIRKLRNQHVHYSQTIRILLEPIADEFELAELLQEPNGQLWKGDKMARRLGERLGDSYSAYQGTIGDIERIIRKIASKLDLERAAELTRNDLEAMLAANPKKGNDRFEFRKRVKFGMSKKSIKALLEELDDCNKELERFTDKSERIETIRRKTIKPSFANRLQRIQKYASTLHETLSTCWSCTCESSHRTRLQLDQRSDLYTSATTKKSSQSSATCFKVSFSSDPGDSQLWSWQAAEILVEEEEDDLSLLRPPTLSKMRKTVSFGDKPPPPYYVDNPTTAGATAPSLEEIKDLCASIQKFHKISHCIGFSFDTKNRLRGAYTVDTLVGKQVVPSEYLTLEQLLDQPPTIKGRIAKLSKRERYSLALTLASSTLQLNATPWFKDQWSAKDVLFQQTESGPRLVDVDRPYVAPKVEALAALTNGRPKRSFQNKNTVLLALAVALLELYFGVSAENHRDLEKQPVGAFNPWMLCAMAYEWADEEQENLSAAFSGAVNHCLRCFNDPSANLQDAEFLQAAVECIVLPLQEELHQFLGKAGP
ncbi:hypothetical protein P171DRAFT_483499 [Karstenula rhodostoma CBS 690.94]|uniref:DUF7580 domain-containing protein n=1 Tax=Karstenula rhodostoma CBS 690.94 TaxID=1392251 RepID=A0A9P4PNH0_9PLEO|nr:hypothetical protein P171DRAFT_483499 [Karstenula rhodostoma CBS 690.94]